MLGPSSWLWGTGRTCSQTPIVHAEVTGYAFIELESSHRTGSTVSRPTSHKCERWIPDNAINRTDVDADWYYATPPCDVMCYLTMLYPDVTPCYVVTSCCALHCIAMHHIACIALFSVDAMRCGAMCLMLCKVTWWYVMLRHVRLHVCLYYMCMCPWIDISPSYCCSCHLHLCVYYSVVSYIVHMHAKGTCKT